MAYAPVLDSHGTTWNQYGSWNRRHEGLARVWVRDLIGWLKSHPSVNKQASILDFGCGYFDVGLALSSLVPRVDGFDVSPEACEVAAFRAQGCGEKTQIFKVSSDIPVGTYDLIVVNSVIQYFADSEILRQHFFLWKSLLKDSSTGQIVLADIIPKGYVSWRDAMRSMQVAWQEKMVFPMMIHLWKAATKPKDLSLFRIDLDELRSLAKSAGFKVASLPANLTPSRQRYSVVVSSE